MGTGETNMRVVIRVRPNNRRELEQSQRTIVKVIDSETLLFDPDEDEDEFFYQGVKQSHRDITKRANKKLSMEFDRIFAEDNTNEQIFEECTKPLVKSVMNGYNCSVFVYGATGAGKTFTMLGSESCPGLTFLTMRELFESINALSDDRKFDIGISYLEVYNEQVMNLLTRTGPMRLCEDSNGVVVNGLVLRPIYDAEELISLLVLGNKNRTQHPTDANAESSRSHAVFQVHIRMTDKKTGQKRTVKLSMIDLAGSERAASTKGIGVRFKEGASINKSLLALGNCINKLADGSKHIPYRDSNLTRLLKDSLGGNCQTVMIANVSPSSLTYEDTYNTLKYASRAKKIRIVLKQNILKTNMPKDFFVKKVSDQRDEIEKLKELNRQLEQRLQSQAHPPSAFDESILTTWFEKIDCAYLALIAAQEGILHSQSKEKILKFRAKLKEYAEDGQRALSLDGVNVNKELAKMEASIDRFGKQAEKMKEELVRWRKRHHDALQTVTKLRQECQESKCSKMLLRYLQGKEYEVEISKKTIKHNHVDAINSLYHAELDHLRTSHLLGCKVIQRNYLLLRANGLVDSEFQDSLNRMVQLNNGQRDVRFFDNDTEKDVNTKEWVDISFDGIEDATVVRQGLKRANSNEEPANSQPRNRKLFKSNEIYEEENSDENIDNDLHVLESHPSGVGMNETQVLSSARELNVDVNATFQLPSSNQNKDFVNGILMEQNAKVSNKNALSKALIKSNVGPQKLINKVSLAVSKENIKRYSPSKIRKSPRPASRTVTGRALASAANFISRHRTTSQTNTGDGESKAVRINRTASMRIKRPQIPPD